MSDLIFSDLFEQNPIQSPQAADYCRNYPALNKDESWRWTPLSVLRKEQRTLVYADYQLDVPDAVEESFDVNPQIEKILASEQAVFAALNIALLNDTLTFNVPDHTVIEQSIAININALTKQWQFSQIAIALGQGAKANFWIDISGQRAAAQNCVITLQLDDHAVLEGMIWQSAQDQRNNANLVYVDSHQGHHSRLNIVGVQHDCALSRLDIDAHLEGDHVSFNFGGLQLASGENVADYHVKVQHYGQSSQSRQIVRGVLSEQSFAIFDGLIYVAEGAQLTDAQQNSRFVLLSEQAKAQSVPRLEIYADDVQCAHGSTVGFIDKEALFYMQSRGIGYEEAQQLLLTGFLQEAITIEDSDFKTIVDHAILQVWQGDDDA